MTIRRPGSAIAQNALATTVGGLLCHCLMQSRPVDQTAHRRWSWLLAASVTVLALAPWWRNHRYLRDFYDYGLVMAGNARITGGERPYVDFVTPIQTGTFLFNGWPERLGGDTYQAMTRGAAALTILGVALLAGVLLRRWSTLPAIGLAGAVVCMTATQHTIIWHNTLGALCLAVAVCSAAIAPVIRREHLGWHLLTAGALAIGGITKLNAQLVAICGVLAWTLLQGFKGRASWSRVSVTALLVLLFAGVLPVAFELAWTHATPAQWWHNVVAMPFGSRTGDLGEALHGKFYFQTRHDYYGALPVPQLGAVGLAVTAAFVVAAIRALGWRQAGWIVAAALFAAASGAALLATNYEIAYVAIGAWFALVAALWLGFDLRGTGRFFYGGLIVPALVVGALAWQSAWTGQRALFGYSTVPRADYVDGGKAAEDFSYMRGTMLPPEIGDSMTSAANWFGRLSAQEKAGVFYGPGLEWLERIWPARKLPDMPLWMHLGTSYGEAEEARLLKAMSAPDGYRYVLVPEARDYWGAMTKAFDRFNKRHAGPVWFLYERLPVGVVSWRPLEFLHDFGGNVNSTWLHSTMAMQSLADGRSFIGVNHGAGELMLTAPSNRAQGEAVVRLRPGEKVSPAAKIRFEVFSVAGGNYYPRWSAEVGLPENQAEVVVPFPVDCGGSPLRFLVTIPPELSGRVAAGWRALQLLHSVDGPAAPTRLQLGAQDAYPASAAMRRALLPADWNPSEVLVRNCRVGDRGLEVSPGGEIWIRLAGLHTAIDGVATVADGIPLPADPVVRVLYLKGAKLEVLTQSAIRAPERKFAFRAWSAEPDGWLVILTEPNQSTPPVAVGIKSVH